jgi:putative flippase GtrA
MNLSPSSLIAYAGGEETRKRLRYAGVTAVFVPIGQGLIQVLGVWLDDYTAASVLASAIVAFPMFFANKHFVWRLTSGKNLHSQVLLFWVAGMLSMLLATLFTYLVEKMTAGQTALVQGTAVFFAQLFGLGIVWIGRFLILDRWLFKVSADTPST